jgi:hypothetical protein
MQQGEYRAEILARPKFLLYEDAYANKFGAAFQVVLNRALRKLWESNVLSDPRFEKTIISSPLTLPAGTDWSSNAKIYKLNSGTTPVLTADLYRLKKLWITNAAGAITYSKSTYDSTTVEGTGIPDDNTVVAVTDVYHELIGEGANQELQIVVGTTAQGTTPKVLFTYAPTLILLSGNTDEIPVPAGLFLGSFEPLVEAELNQFFGTNGF